MRPENPGDRLYAMAVVAAGAALAGVSAAAAALLLAGHPDHRTAAALVPLLGLCWLVYRAYRRQAAAGARRIDRLMRIHLSTIEALALAIDAKDPHARGHAQRVQALALELARRLRLPRREFEAIRAAALLHDIGKLAIPDHLLHKPGRLSAMEFQKIKVHPAVAADILASVEFPYPVVPAIRHHHERWDGSGYPDGLKGDGIPLAARVLAVADAFEALTSDRVYRLRKSHEEACSLLEAWAGIHFDPEVVATLRDHLPAMVEIAERARGALPGPESHPAAAPPVPPEAAAGAPAMAEDPGGFGDRLHRGVGAERAAAPPSRDATIWLEREADGTLIGRRSSVFSDITSAHREVYALYEIAQTLGSSLRLAEVLDLVVTRIGQVVPYHSCVFYMLEDGSDLLSARFVSGANADLLRGRSVRVGDGVTGWAAAHRSDRFSASPDLDLQGSGIDPAAYSTVAAFPVCHDGRLLGVITLYFPRGVPCLDDHIRMMDIIARLLAGAVFNSTVFAETQESALRDDLTSLPNSRYLKQVFEQEKVRSQQAGQPMAFLEMDLDDFKAINDRHGHQVGDRYLAEISRVLRSHLRERDILVRLSGDEFAAILPLTGFAPAALLAERLQHAVDVFSLRLDEGKVARSGLSVGIALYPQDAESFEDLLVRADYNMYQNKSARKNSRLERGPNVLPFPVKPTGTRQH
jgi:diguanylate cyclase (GGDEF)-like protein/putative nucleotidyltransferase with HDIG domain